MTEEFLRLRGPYDTIFLDVGETLVHLDPPFITTVKRVANQFNVTRVPDNFEQRVHDIWDKNIRSAESVGHSLTTISSRQYWHRQYARIGQLLDVREQEAFGYALYECFSSFDAYAPMPGSVDTLRALNRLGLRVVAASNWEGWLGQLLTQLGLDRFFAVQVVSADIGFEKPNPKFFDCALMLSATDRRRVVHVGDGLVADVQGAASSGIDAIWVSTSDTAGFQGTRISSIAELPDLIRPFVASVPWALPTEQEATWI